MPIKKYQNSNELGEKLKNLRINVGEKFSQEQIADYLGVSKSTVVNLENGKGIVKESMLLKYCEIFEMPMSFFVNTDAYILGLNPEDKYYTFKKVLLYILNKVGDKPKFGKKVFYKLLYFTEFNYFELTGKSLFHIDFRKFPMGPVPDPEVVDKIFDDMISKNQLSKISTLYRGYEQQRFISGLKDIGIIDIITDESIGKDGSQVINDVITELSNMTGNEISEYSQEDMPFLATKNYYDIIDKQLVFYRSPKYEYVKDESSDYSFF